MIVAIAEALNVGALLTEGAIEGFVALADGELLLAVLGVSDESGNQDEGEGRQNGKEAEHLGQSNLIN